MRSLLWLTRGVREWFSWQQIRFSSFSSSTGITTFRTNLVRVAPGYGRVSAADSSGAPLPSRELSAGDGDHGRKAVVCVEGAHHRTIPATLESIAVNAVAATDADVVVAVAIGLATKKRVDEDLEELLLAAPDRSATAQQEPLESLYRTYAEEYYGHFFGDRLRAVDVALEFVAERGVDSGRVEQNADDSRHELYRRVARLHARESLRESAVRARDKSSLLRPKTAEAQKHIDAYRDAVVAKVHPKIYTDLFSAGKAGAQGNYRYEILNHYQKAKCIGLVEKASPETDLVGDGPHGGYDWIVYTRNDLYWAFPHPPLALLDARLPETTSPSPTAQGPPLPHYETLVGDHTKGVSASQLFRAWNRGKTEVDLWIPMCFDYGGLQDRTATVRFGSRQKYFNRLEGPNANTFRGHFGSVVRFPLEQVAEMLEGVPKNSEGRESGPREYDWAALSELAIRVLKLWQLYLLQRDGNTRLAAEMVVSRIVEEQQLVLGRYECAHFLLDSRVDRRRLRGQDVREPRIYVRGATTADVYLNPDIRSDISERFANLPFRARGAGLVDQLRQGKVHAVENSWALHPEPIVQDACHWQWQNFYPRHFEYVRKTRSRMMCKTHIEDRYLVAARRAIMQEAADLRDLPLKQKRELRGLRKLMSTEGRDRLGTSKIDRGEAILDEVLRAFRLNSTRELGSRGWLSGMMRKKTPGKTWSAHGEDTSSDTGTGAFDCTEVPHGERMPDSVHGDYGAYFKNLTYLYDSNEISENSGYGCKRLRVTPNLRIRPDVLAPFFAARQGRLEDLRERGLAFMRSLEQGSEKEAEGGERAGEHSLAHNSRTRTDTEVLSTLVVAASFSAANAVCGCPLARAGKAIGAGVSVCTAPARATRSFLGKGLGFMGRRPIREHGTEIAEATTDMANQAHVQCRNWATEFRPSIDGYVDNGEQLGQIVCSPYATLTDLDQYCGSANEGSLGSYCSQLRQRVAEGYTTASSMLHERCVEGARAGFGFGPAGAGEDMQEWCQYDSGKGRLQKKCLDTMNAALADVCRPKQAARKLFRAVKDSGKKVLSLVSGGKQAEGNATGTPFVEEVN
eukprot:g11594.t1